MCKEQEVRVKIEYLLEAFKANPDKQRCLELYNEDKSCFTYHEFECWCIKHFSFWIRRTGVIDRIFNTALGIQKADEMKCKQKEEEREKVRVKKEYLIEVLPNGYAHDVLKESCKDCFTLDEFIEFRQSPYSNTGRGYPHADLLERRFNEALKLQRKAECGSSNVDHSKCKTITNFGKKLKNNSDSVDIKSIDFVVSILDNCCEYLDEVDQRKHDHSVRLLKVVIDQLKQR